MPNHVIDAVTGRRMPWSVTSPVAAGPVVVVVPNGTAAVPAVAAHAATGTEMLLVADSRLDSSLAEDLRADGFAIQRGTVTERAYVDRPTEDGRLWLLTSGTTGRPKRVRHTLESLTTVRGDLRPHTWLCPYSPGTYAWWQVVTLGLNVPGQDVVRVDPAQLDDWVEPARAQGVTAVSGTPTFWRRTLMTAGESLATLPLEQVTLGGEPVDQAILDELRRALPDARITWIYASTEAGASIVVHDGRAGFPVEWLDDRSRGLRVDATDLGEELLVGPVRTGDAVRVEEGRVLITGRLDRDEINVGGSKVSAGRVRDVLLSHPEVAWAGVRGRRAPLVGSVVVADVVGRASSDDISRWASERLPEHAVPRRISILSEIPVKETLKSDV